MGLEGLISVVGVRPRPNFPISGPRSRVAWVGHDRMIHKPIVCMGSIGRCDFFKEESVFITFALVQGFVALVGQKVGSHGSQKNRERKGPRFEDKKNNAGENRGYNKDGESIELHNNRPIPTTAHNGNFEGVFSDFFCIPHEVLPYFLEPLKAIHQKFCSQLLTNYTTFGMKIPMIRLWR